MNGNGGRELTEARVIGEWESATCDPADATRSTSTIERENAAARGLSNCCSRERAAPGGGEVLCAANADGEEDDGGCVGETEAARECRNSVGKRRGCGYSGASKRACFSGTNTAFHCGGSDPDPDSGARIQNRRHSREEAIKPRRRGDFSRGAVGAGGLIFRCAVMNGERRGCRTAKGRVRLHRMRSFLTCENGAQISDHGQGKPRAQSSCPGAPTDGVGSGSRGPAVNGGATAGSLVMQVEAAQVEAKKRQVQLGERTDMLWRRLHAVQVKQLERHVTQQLGDLSRSAVAPDSAELNRFARSCSEALRTAGGALDSDHTASSSGGGSDSEEDEEGGAGGRHVSPSRVKSV